MKIVTIGSATIDVYLQSRAFREIKSDKFLTGIGECLALGSKNGVDDIFVDSGGGATNAAVTFKNLGIKTSVVARIGDDLFGRELTRILKSRKINLEYLQVDKGEKTAYSTLLLLDSGQRSILVYRGASNNLIFPTPPSPPLPTRGKKMADWFYISSLGGNIILLAKILAYAEKNKIKVAYNPGAGELSKGLSKLKKYFRKLEVLNFNREEAALLCKTDYDRMDIMKSKLSGLAKYVIITDGSNGAYALSDKKMYYVPTFGTKPKNTTGAGDAFGSGLVAGLILKNDIKFGLQLGACNSDGVIRKMGAKNGLLEKLPSKSMIKRIKVKEEEL